MKSGVKYGSEILTLNKSDSNMGKENVEKNIWPIKRKWHMEVPFQP
jgi:hypothetical protein